MCKKTGKTGGYGQWFGRGRQWRGDALKKGESKQPVVRRTDDPGTQFRQVENIQKEQQSLNKELNRMQNMDNLSVLCSTVGVFACAGVFLRLNVYSETCSNRWVREDSLIQLSSVDSITNPLHLLKQPPPKNTPLPLFYVHVLGVPGARMRLCLRLHASYRPWPGSAPPTPSCATHINRRKNK